MYLAHAFGQRYDLPIPLALFVVGGAAVVVVSFLLVFRRSVDAEQLVATDTVPPAPLRPGRAAVSLLMLAFVVVVGLLGKQELSENVDPTLFWIVVWIVVPLSCGLLGDWTRTVNPFAVLARLSNRTGVRKALLARTEPLPWRLGWWPAVVLFALMVLGELVFNLTATVPSFIGGALLVYVLLSGAAGLLFGAGWLERGEVFSVLFDVWGRLGYWRHGAPGRRGFAGGLDVPFEACVSRVVFVLLMLVNINFDGLTGTQRWTRFERQTLGTSGAPLEAVKALSLLVLVLVVLTLFGVFATAAARAGRHGTTFLPSLAGLLPSLVPIAFGYLIAHYCSYVVTNLQLLFPLIGNPGFTGWPITLPFPFSDSYEVHLTLLPASFYWYLSLAAIVLAHVAAVLLAHRHLGTRTADEQRARASEYPWLVAMVLYTVFSLFLIAQTEATETAAPEKPAAVASSRSG